MAKGISTPGSSWATRTRHCGDFFSESGLETVWNTVSNRRFALKRDDLAQALLFLFLAAGVLLIAGLLLSVLRASLS